MVDNRIIAIFSILFLAAELSAQPALRWTQIETADSTGAFAIANGPSNRGTWSQVVRYNSGCGCILIGTDTVLTNITGAVDFGAELSAANVTYGTGSAGYMAEWLNDSTLQADLTGAYRVSVGTTAQRPTLAAGLVRMNSTEGELEFSPAGSTWYAAVRSSDYSLTSGSVPYVDANGALAEDNSGLFFNAASNKLAVNTATATDAQSSMIIRSPSSFGGMAIKAPDGPRIFFDEGSDGSETQKAFFGLQQTADAFVLRHFRTGIAGNSLLLRIQSGGTRTASAGSSNVFDVYHNGLVTANHIDADTITVDLARLVRAGIGTQNAADTEASLVVREAADFGGMAIRGRGPRIFFDVGSDGSELEKAFFGIQFADTSFILRHFGAGGSGSADLFEIQSGGDRTTPGTTRFLIEHNGYASFSSTEALEFHSGTTAQRPTGAAALQRWNTSTTKMEYHDGTDWRNFASESWVTSTVTAAEKWLKTELEDGTNVTITPDGSNLVIDSLSNLRITTKGVAVFEKTAGTGELIVRAVQDSARFEGEGVNLESTAFLTVTATDDVIFTADNIRFNGVAALSEDAALVHRSGDGLVGTRSLDPETLWGSETSALLVPVGTTAQRPTAADFLIRGNSSNTKLETYYSAEWKNIATEDWVMANTVDTWFEPEYSAGSTIAASYDDGIGVFSEARFDPGTNGIQAGTWFQGIVNGYDRQYYINGRANATAGDVRIGTDSDQSGTDNSTIIRLYSTDTDSYIRMEVEDDATAFSYFDMLGDSIRLKLTDNTYLSLGSPSGIAIDGLNTETSPDTLLAWDSSTKQVRKVATTGGVGSLAVTTTDADVTVTEAQAEQYAHITIWMILTNGGPSAVVVATLPTPTAAMIGTRVTVISEDDDVTYNSQVGTSGNNIWAAGSLVSNVSTANHTVTELTCAYNGTNYYWILNNQY